MASTPESPREYEFSAEREIQSRVGGRAMRFAFVGAIVGIVLAFLGLGSDYYAGSPDSPGRATADWFGLRLREREYTPDAGHSLPPFLYAFTDSTGISIGGGVIVACAAIGGVVGLVGGFVWSRRTKPST
jgi:hypothetical protein